MTLALATATPSSGERIYLDTSAVLPLALVEGGRRGQPTPPPREQQRAALVTAFGARAAKAGCKLVTSILALEEIAARARNKARLQEQRTYSSWDDFRRANASAAEDAEKRCQAHMLATLTWTIDVLHGAGVTVDFPSVLAAETENFAKKLRKAHLELLRAYASIDPMDALHIVFGLEGGAHGFVTFDGAWASVREIVVYT